MLMLLFFLHTDEKLSSISPPQSVHMQLFVDIVKEMYDDGRQRRVDD